MSKRHTRMLEAVGTPAEETAAQALSPAKPAPTKPVPRREDQEFLPAALEILETPPSPVRMAMIVFFAILVVTALIWMYFGRFDIVASAQGKIQPPDRVKVVQPVETGKVSHIAVRNGMSVAEGDVLLELEKQDARADVTALEAAAAALESEIVRRAAALLAGSQRRGEANGQDSTPHWPAHLPSLMIEREESVLRADIAQLDAGLGAIRAQVALKLSEKQRLGEMINAQTALVANLQERVDMRSALATSGSGSRASLIDGRETLLKEEAVLTGHRGQLREADAALRVLASEREKLLNTFMAENTQKKADLAKSLEEAVQRLAKARHRLVNTTLRSPVDGVIQASVLYTVGQVVTIGQELMRVVPTGERLEIEAYLPNKDIGFIRPGQEVSVKVDSFPFTRYGLLKGKVHHIAKDAIPLPDVAQIEGNPARGSDSQTFAGAQRTQNLVFPIIITLESSTLSVDGQPIALKPGMTVTAEIKTGSRRILEYLFSPLVEVSASAMRER